MSMRLRWQAILYAPFRVLRRSGSAEEAGIVLHEQLSDMLEAEIRYSSEALKVPFHPLTRTLAHIPTRRGYSPAPDDLATSDA